MAPCKTIDRRESARALVCASALVVANGRSTATHHLVHDLSVDGVRLCGLPDADLDDWVEVVLFLPKTEIRLGGHLVHGASAAGRASFAIEFGLMPALAEDAIHDAVLDALADGEQRHSVLLFRDHPNALVAGWEWLEPILPICEMATLPSDAVSCLESEPIQFGIIGASNDRAPLPYWAAAYPEIRWQFIDETGCLHRRIHGV